MDKQLTLLEAYKAMIQFIKDYYYRKGKPDELGILLSDISLLNDNTPMDPAMWQDWLDAIDKTIYRNN
jgi:hypothetical protein